MTRERAESFFGAIGAALVAIYAIGFLILSLYDARFGIVELDPFRARMLATGAAFVCLLVLPVAALRYGFTKLPVLDPITRPGEPRLERSRKTILLRAFIYTAWVMAFSLWLLVFPTVPSAPSPWPYRAEASVAVVFFFISFSAIVKHFPARPGRCVALALLSAALFYVAMQKSGAIGDLTIWFFLVGVITFYLSEAEDPLREALHWWNWLAVLVLVAFYASNIYGRILPKYGGGAPTPIVLYLNRPLPWAASRVNTTALLDETDRGYFVTTPRGDGALFIPRSDVSAIYFGPSSHAPKASSHGTGFVPWGSQKPRPKNPRH